MKLYRSLKLSGNALLSNKLRTFLALMGISIGVAAVIIMVAIGQGAQREVMRQIESMGTNLLTIKAGQVKKLVQRDRQLGDVTSLTVKDSRAIVWAFPYVAAAAPAQDRSLRVKYGNISTMAEVVGTTPNFKDIRNYFIADGRFFSEDESKAGVRVAVIGSDVYKNLFKNQDPIGEIIRINKIPFQVTGLLKPIGASAEGGNEDNRVIIPMRTALRRVFNTRHLEVIYVQVRERALMHRAETEIRELLRERHGLAQRQKSDDFTIRSQVTALEIERESTDSFTLLITGIAAISLLVGGIGILAIMLLAIKERTNEIGLRRAVGARSKDILLQFLVEALMLGLAGGLPGMFIGVTGAGLIGVTTALTTTIPVQTILLSIMFSLSVGLFFGVYPARQASLLDPIEALRAG
jgi:putative ABC transport system permease protein